MVVHRSHFYRHSCRAQRGAALLLAMFMIGLVVTAYVMQSYDAAEIKARQEEKTMKALAEAKEALIAWSVTHSQTPGQMPWPDRREITNPNYDGRSDCSSASFELVNSQGEANFLGQLPSLSSTAPCLIYPGIGHYQDAYGNKLWYAVSRNLVRNYVSPATNPVINPGVITAPTYPWMVVRDSQGRVISNRVAIVIIAPGLPLPGQHRSTSAPPASAYLDTMEINGNVYSNADYLIDNEDFIQGPTTASFNDRLVYITIDELITNIAKRVAQEIRSKTKYFSTDGIIKACMSGDARCSGKITSLVWDFKGSYVVTPSDSSVASYAKLQTPKQFQCSSDVDSLKCSGEDSPGQHGQENPTVISVEIPFNGQHLIGLGVQKRTVERVRAERGEVKVIRADKTITIHPTDSGGIIELGNPGLTQNHVDWPEWYFNNDWDQYTDILMFPGQETHCDVNCFILLRKNGIAVNKIRQLVLVRRRNIDNVSIPIVNEWASGILAASWIQDGE